MIFRGSSCLQFYFSELKSTLQGAKLAVQLTDVPQSLHNSSLTCSLTKVTCPKSIQEKQFPFAPRTRMLDVKSETLIMDKWTQNAWDVRGLALFHFELCLDGEVIFTDGTEGVHCPLHCPLCHYDSCCWIRWYVMICDEMRWDEMRWDHCELFRVMV